jgi:twitching motility protein PilJ
MNDVNTQAKPARTWGLMVQTGLLLATLAFVAITFFLLARDAQQQQGWAQLANEIQVTSQQLSKSAGDAAAVEITAFEALGNSFDRLRKAIEVLERGSPEEGLRPVASAVAENFAELTTTWQRVAANTERIREREPLILAMAESSAAITSAIPQLQTNADAAVQALIEYNGSSGQVAAASSLPVLSERMLRRIAEILRGGSDAVTAASALDEDIRRFDENLDGLLKGDSRRGISQVNQSRATAALNRVRNDFAAIRQALQDVLSNSTALFEVRGAADEIFLDGQLLFDRAVRLSAAIVNLPQQRLWPSIPSGVAGLILMFLFVALLVRIVINAERQRATVATIRDRQNQNAIRRLLDELDSLANGDLTVQATVSEEITRDIAKAVNYAIRRLREIVTGINQTAHAVAQSAQTTRTETAQLAKDAGEQAEQVDAATEDVRNMASAFDSVARRSQDSAEVAHTSVAIADNGADKVRQTIAGMDLIREQIQETSKRIKRLGESSQEIGDIVGLINGIAEQTNVLALNAAIQAASAGGAGKGFAMVADEVQELAESATQATRRIESLVQTIQADTSEAVHSMESTTSEVVRGANLAEDAGAALQKIEKVSNDLSEMIQQISEEAQSQSATATRISELMHAVRDVSVKNSTGSKQTAETIENLAELVLQLSESVSDFKLPGTETTPVKR